MGRRVQDARKKAGLTQAKLAEAAGVTDETLSRLERGKFAVAPETLLAVADALGASLDGLTGRTGKHATVGREPPIVGRIVRIVRGLSALSQSAVLTVAVALERTERQSRTRRPKAPLPRRRSRAR